MKPLNKKYVFQAKHLEKSGNQHLFRKFLFRPKPLLFCLTLVFSVQTYAQQNLFNIPSGDLTPQGKFFFQHQTNFYHPSTTESKNHFVWGLGSGWEIGANVLNLKLDWRSRHHQTQFLTLNNEDQSLPMKPLVQLTAQKFFFLGEKFKTSLGTQVGTNPFGIRADPRWTHFTYNMWVYEPRSHVKFTVGSYLTDRGTVGEGNNVGVMLGFEYPVHKRLLVMGDLISGSNAATVSVLGLNYLASRRLQLCLGGLLPNPGSGNPFGMVFEVNVLGFDDF